MITDKYEAGYEHVDARFAGWRALCGEGKISRVVTLLGTGHVGSLVDVRCGEGVLLAKFDRMGIADHLAGLEIAQSAVDHVAGLSFSTPVSVNRFDGYHIEAADKQYDVAVLSHVLEHALAPSVLLAEAARVAGVVIFEVPLEDTLSSHRARYPVGAAEIGHVQRFSPASVRGMAAGAGVTIEAEMFTSRTRESRRYWADTRAARLRADGIWATTRVLDLVPSRSRRLVPLDYTCRCRQRSL